VRLRDHLRDAAFAPEGGNGIFEELIVIGHDGGTVREARQTRRVEGKLSFDSLPDERTRPREWLKTQAGRVAP